MALGLDDKARRTRPPFDPQRPDKVRFGLLNQFPEVPSPARSAALPRYIDGAGWCIAETLTEPHELGHALGKVARRAVRHWLAGRPTVGCALKLRYRIALRRGGCGYPNKRWVTMRMPMLRKRNGEVARKAASGLTIQTAFQSCFAERKAGCGRNIANRT